MFILTLTLLVLGMGTKAHVGMKTMPFPNKDTEHRAKEKIKLPFTQ